MKPLLKLMLWLVLALILALAGLSAFLFIAGRDIDPPDVSDVLPPSTPPIAEAENMVPILMEATNRLALTKNDLQLMSRYCKDGWDHKIWTPVSNMVLTAAEATAWADRILATNAVLFAAFDEAAKRPRAQYPARFAWVCSNCWNGCPDVLSFGQLWHFETVDAYMYGNLVALRARRLRECGQEEKAVGELLKYGEMFARLSYRMENGTVVLYLRSPVRPVIEEIVRLAIAHDLPTPMYADVDAALLRWRKGAVSSFRMANRLAVLRAKNRMSAIGVDLIDIACDEIYGPTGDLVRRFFMRRDFMPGGLQALDRWVNKAIVNFPGYRRYLIQPNRTLQEFAGVIRELESYAYSIPYPVAAREAFRKLGKSHPPVICWTQRNGIGRSEVNSYAGWGLYNRRLGGEVFWMESCRVSIAAARYRRKHGRCPSTLDALASEFLAEVPRDPFDASRPLGYNAEQGTLHTVGAEGSFSGKVRKPYLPYGGLAGHESRYIRRLDGRPMEIPLKPLPPKERKRKNGGE